MFHLNWKERIIILVILILQSSDTHAKSTTKGGVSEFTEKKLVKRGHIDAANEYGPPIHITSSVLQLEKSPEIELIEPNAVEDESSLEEVWKDKIDSTEHAFDWNGITTGWQPIYKVILAAGKEYSHHDDTDGSIFSYDTHKILPPEGLHTKIIASSGLDFVELNDKLDAKNVINDKEKYYIKSYG